MAEATHREVELRLVVADHAALEENLRAAGATTVGRGVVATSAFDFDDGRLHIARQTLRLREDWTGTTLTIKSPVAATSDEDASRMKVREEVNVALVAGAGPDALLFLGNLGLRETLRYVKRRTSWALGKAHIDVDVLDDGGACFVEIEGDPATVTGVRTALGLEDAPIEIRSYFAIVRLARQGQQEGEE